LRLQKKKTEGEKLEARVTKKVCLLYLVEFECIVPFCTK